MVHFRRPALDRISVLFAAKGNEKTMSPTKPKIVIGRFRYLALAAALATYLLIVIGGIVRVTGSGLGCPDWPTCFGRLLPPPDIKAQIEFSHRLWASAITSPLILLAAIWAWQRFGSIKMIWRPLLWALPLLAVQGLLGGIVVLTETPSWLVAIHLGAAFLLLALLIATAVTAYARHQNPAQPDR